MEFKNNNGVTYSLLVVVLAISGVDLGKTDSITTQLSAMNTRLTLVEYRIKEIEENNENNKVD